MSGFVGDLSPKQDDALRKLRVALSDIEKDLPDNDDYFYLRWLRAHRFKVDKAEECIRNHIEFRQQFGIDSTLRGWTPPEVLTKFIPGGFFGEDREGHPVWHSNMGNLDIRGLCHSARKEDLLHYIIHYIETSLHLLDASSEKYDRHIETFTSVIDLEHLSYKKHFYWPGVVMFREFLTILQTNYPERIKRVLIVKAPKIFPVGYSFVKHFMDERTKEKIIVFGHNADNWQEELHKYISPDQLPQAYGGTRCEPDPYCTDYINSGGDVPEEYQNLTTEASRDEMERVIIRRRGVHELECQVTQPGTVLQWEFVTIDHGINFGWYHKATEMTKSSNAFNVVPLRKANSHLVPEVGCHKCTQTGIYIMKFDNSHSWTHSKEVFYSIKFLPPDSDKSDDIDVSLPHLLSTELLGISSPVSEPKHENETEEQDDSRSLYFTPSTGNSPSFSPAQSTEEIN